MRQNLSFEKIAGALAVLGTGVLMAACGGEEPKTPVNANEVNGATEKSADGANHCGAGKDHKGGEAACSADHKAADTAAKPADPTAATPATTPAAATPADAKPADAKPADAKAAAPAATGAAKKPAAPAATPAKKGGSGSCGAGTCSAKK